MACPNMRAALKHLTVRQIRGHLGRDLGIDDVPETKLAATNTAIRLASQSAERLQFQWGLLAKKLTLPQLHALTDGSCPRNKRSALQWLVEADTACLDPTAANGTTKRHMSHFKKARALLAKRLRRAPQSPCPAEPVPAQPVPVPAQPVQLPLQAAELRSQLKTAVKTVLSLDGLSQTLVDVRHQVSGLVGVDCKSGPHAVTVDHFVSKLLAKKRAAVQAEEDALRPTPTFSRPACTA